MTVVPTQAPGREQHSPGRTPTTSIIIRCLLLGGAYLWSAAVLGVVFAHHLNQVTQQVATINGKGIYITPAAQTLYQQDRVSGEIFATAIAIALVIATADLLYRVLRKRSDIGPAALAIGYLLILFSLFGLGWGLLAFGPIALFIILSSLPFRFPKAERISM
jgi:hypothetical protein